MKYLALIAGLLLVSGVASAKIYKWVDANGEVHYQDHPRGTPQTFSTGEGAATHSNSKKSVQINTEKLIKSMEKSRKKREKDHKKKMAEQRKLDEKCIKVRDLVSRLEEKLQKNHSEFSNDRPPGYQRLQARLLVRKQYLKNNCQ